LFCFVNETDFVKVKVNRTEKQMYLIAMARSDICSAVNRVAQFVQKPEASHWEAVKRR
jgi:hypothetical protein